MQKRRFTEKRRKNGGGPLYRGGTINSQGGPRNRGMDHYYANARFQRFCIDLDRFLKVDLYFADACFERIYGPILGPTNSQFSVPENS